MKVSVIRGMHSQIANKDTLTGLILILQSQITSQALKTLDLYPFKVEMFQVCFLISIMFKFPFFLLLIFIISLSITNPAGFFILN